VRTTRSAPGAKVPGAKLEIEVYVEEYLRFGLRHLGQGAEAGETAEAVCKAKREGEQTKWEMAI